MSRNTLRKVDGKRRTPRNDGREDDCKRQPHRSARSDLLHSLLAAPATGQLDRSASGAGRLPAL